MTAFYAINMTLLGIDYKSSSNVKHDLEDRIKKFESYTAKVILMPIQALGACHGPFESLEKAQKWQLTIWTKTIQIISESSGVL